MQPLQPEQATFLLQSALPTIKNEYKTTCKVIEAVPLDKGDYKPDPASMSALELAWHIAAAESMFMDGVASGGFNFGGGARPDSIRTSADVLKWYTETFDANFKRLTEMNADQLLKVLDFHGMFRSAANSLKVTTRTRFPGLKGQQKRSQLITTRL